MRVASLFTPALAALALGLAPGCSPASGCDSLLCGACPTPISLVVTLATPGAGPVTVTGPGDVGCSERAPGTFDCGSGTAAPGDYTLTVSAPGHASRTLSFTLSPAPAGCCTCAGTYADTIALGAVPDADAGPADAGADDGGAADAGMPAGDAGACNAAAVLFPMGGALEPGTLCDDVFVCLASAADAAAVMAASARFTCDAAPAGPCPGATCQYADPGGPSVLDADEIAEICAVTLVSPTPELTCRVYL